MATKEEIQKSLEELDSAGSGTGNQTEASQELSTELLLKLLENSGSPWNHSTVLILSIGLLVFAAIVMGMFCWLLFKGKSSTDIIRTFALPLVIFSAVFLVLVGYSQEQIAPVLSLLSAIAGYLLGSQRKDNSKKNPPSTDTAPKENVGKPNTG